MNPDEAQGYAALANAINNMRVSVLVIMCSAGLCAFAMWLWSRRAAQKAHQEDATCRLKSDRELTHALSKLATSVSSLDKGVDRMSQKNQETTDVILMSLSKQGSTIRSLVSKLTSRMSVNDSARIVRNAFEKIAFRDICMVIERALRENDYTNRRGYVERKVKTAIAEVLSEVRETLATYPLGLEIREYFPLAPDVSGERFILAQSLWSRIEPLFIHGDTLENRIQEAFLLVENVVRDHVTMCYQRVVEADNIPSSPYATAAGRAALKTPLPGVSSDTDTVPSVSSGEFARPGEAASTMARRMGISR